METKYIRLFTSSAIIVDRLKTLLENEHIETLVKDAHESGRLAGFGTLDNAIELFVFQDDLSKAQSIATEFERELNN